MSSVSLTFLGTGNFYAPGRYWNSFLINGHLLVEAAPSVLPNLRRAGVDPAAIDAIFISHFHADHTFGWPFLLLSLLARERRSSALSVVGPAGVAQFLANMVRAGKIDHIVEEVSASLGGFDLRFLEVNQREQRAESVQFQAVQVEHDPRLECYGFLFKLDGLTVGYSGDTRLCAGLRQIAAESDILVLECSHLHPDPDLLSKPAESSGHTSMEDVRTLRHDFPNLPFVLTHVDDDIDAGDVPGVRIAEDFETICF